MSEIAAPRFGSLTLDGFIELLGSASPSPGGGAAAALAAAVRPGRGGVVAGRAKARPH